MIGKSGQGFGNTSRFHYKFQLISHILLGITMAVSAPMIAAQDPDLSDSGKKTSGEIAIDTQSEKRDPYLETQRETLAYFKNLKGQLQEASRSGRKLIIPDAHSIQYLAGLYLFCSEKKGVCPSILEALLEIDLVNSKLNNVTVCPVMKSFWKVYLENEFEDRMKYALSTGFMAKVSEFNAKERPKYLRCDETLKALFAEGASASALFAARYGANSRPLHAIDEVITLINAVTDNNINVFVATGAQ